jgi:hypothetical protein
MQGFDEGLALHCGKILECAAIAAAGLWLRLRGDYRRQRLYAESV